VGRGSLYGNSHHQPDPLELEERVVPLIPILSRKRKEIIHPHPDPLPRWGEGAYTETVTINLILSNWRKE